jgi:hypothetical protein
MSEYYLVANLDTEQYVHPGDFLPDRDEDGNPEQHTQKETEMMAAINHIDWADGDSSWIIPYLMAETQNNAIKDLYGEYFGAWSGDAITLIGDTTEHYNTITDTYENISEDLFAEVDGCHSEIQPGSDVI